MRDNEDSQGLAETQARLIGFLDEVDVADVAAESQKIEKTTTQDGIARVFARRYRGRLRYCHHARA